MIDQKLRELGLELPQPPAPVGSYVLALRTGNLVVTSGQLPVRDGKTVFAGRVGSDLDLEAGQAAARLCALNALAQIKACLGTLESVTRIVRLEGFVLSAPGFQSQPQVLNGASELMVQLFGEAGKHTRIAIGAAELPLNAAVQMAIWAEVSAN